MFKYVADIISKISIKQRLLALVFVLFSITTIIVVPKVIDTVMVDTEELRIKVDNQRNLIVKLTSHITDLNNQIMDNQISCTEKFVAREIKIQRMLSHVENKLVDDARQLSQLNHTTTQYDTIVTSSGVFAPEQGGNSEILNMVRDIKADIQKTIEDTTSVR